MDKPKLIFYGGAGSVTGANAYMEFPTGKEPLRILLDCGMVQGEKIGEMANREPFAYDPASIDALFISHAHIDHTGRIPLLVKAGFTGAIYSTHPTKEIARALLEDSMGILNKEAEESGMPPLYEEKDVVQAMSLWKTLDYRHALQLGEVFITLLDAGHVLGSAMTEIRFRNKKFVYTGDLGNSPAPFLPDTEEVKDATFLAIESVYGDRNHEHRSDRKQILEDVIEETMHKKGTLMIPAFSFERTQELLFEIREMVEQSRIPLVPIYLDSPLAIRITKIYSDYMSYYKQSAQKSPVMGDTLFGFPQLHMVERTEDSRAITRKPGPKIVIAGSGMSNGGRILHHEKAWLPDKNSTLLIMGYQAVGTLGRRIQDGARSVRIMGQDVPIRARVVSIGGYSAHKDSDALFEFVANSSDTLKQVLVVLGEPKSGLFMVQRIRDYLGISARMPEPGEEIVLDW